MTGPFCAHLMRTYFDTYEYSNQVLHVVSMNSGLFDPASVTHAACSSYQCHATGTVTPLVNTEAAPTAVEVEAIISKV